MTQKLTMNIHAIRTVFLALETGSLSAAAAQLGVPPSTVSRRIKELEADLGRRLIVRGGRGVSAAEEAKDILSKLKDVLLAVDDCYVEPSSITRLRVAATLEMSVSLLPDLIPGFLAQYPNTFIELVGDDQFVGLIEADFDLAIRTGPLKDSSLIARRLRSDGLVLVAAPSLAQRLNKIEDLASTPFVQMAGRSPGVSGHWKGEPFNITPPLLARLMTFTATVPCLVAGLAYGEMPLHIAKGHIKAGQLVRLSDCKLHDVPVHALYPRHHRNQQAITAFVDQVEAALNVPDL